MSIMCAGNHGRAARTARGIAQALNPVDVESIITQHMTPEEHRQLLCSVDERYPQLEKQQIELYEQLNAALPSEEAKNLLCKLDEVSGAISEVKQLAWFHLGFAAKTRLFDNPPTMDVISGGVTELKPRLKGNCKL